MPNHLDHKQKKLGDYIVDYLGTQSTTFSKYEFLKSLQLIWPALTELDLAKSKTSIEKKLEGKFYQSIKAYKFHDDVAIAFGTHSPSAFEKTTDDHCSLILPLKGTHNIIESENRFKTDSRDEQGAFLSGSETLSTTSDIEAIAISLNPEKLKKMMRHFAKNKKVKVPDISHKLDFKSVKLNDLRRNFFRSINSAGYFGAFDQVTADMIMRHTALIMLVSMGEELKQNAYTNNSQIIDRLCSRMYSNLSESYTLTFMESFSGLSARVLQKEFNKRFGLSPFSWLNEQRLFRAKDMLSNPNVCKNVSEVSRDCGFSHLGRFSVNFKRKFGVGANSFKNNK